MRLTTAALSIALSACASGGTPLPPPKPIESIPFASSLDVDLSKMTKTPSGLYYRDIEVGTGVLVKGKMNVRVHYTGWLTNGEKFDSNGPDDQPLEVPVGRGRAIKGWDEGLQGMRAGGRRQLVVPSALAYGSEHSGIIPPDAVLVFDIRVVSAEY
ncbi:MAG: FKBP-type peptidyl-prolyl cis-trans isomerase [Gemmatimonadales bacterium]